MCVCMCVVVSILWCGGEFTHRVGGRCVCVYVSILWCGGEFTHRVGGRCVCVCEYIVVWW